MAVGGVKKKPVDPAWQKLLALFGLWLITIFKILIPTATRAKHFLVLVALIGLFELCLLFIISTLVLLALIGLLATRLYLAFSGEGGLFGLRRTRMVGDQHNDLESQVLNSDEAANKE
nr:hypothetical protein B0A51_04178 [Rachicladosporium sp. CCFEE 5018]